MYPANCRFFFLSMFFVFSMCSHVYTLDKKLLEYLQPTSCGGNEYFDTVSFSCIECDVTKNLVPSSDRLQCVCSEFSKIVGYKNGDPLCTACDSNTTVTTDRRDCIPCKNSKCNCHQNEIKVERDLNGTLLSVLRCLPCAKGTFPSPDRTSCIACNNNLYDRGAQCICHNTSHVRVGKYCLKKDDLIDWPDVRSTYLVKFESESIDSYYFRMELQAATYFCKKKQKKSCEHLSNMCAITLYTNGIACMLFMQKHVSATNLYYDKEEMLDTLQKNNISKTYSLTKNSYNNVLNITFVKFSLSGDFESIGSSDVYCQILKNVRFGVNIKKKCKLTVTDLLHAKVVFYQPFIIFSEGEKVVSHALPVLIRNSNKNVDIISEAQLVRKFFLIDNVSGFKTLPSFLENRFRKSSQLSVLRYIKSVHVLVNVLSGEHRGQTYPPLIIVEYGELLADQIHEDSNVFISYEVTFMLKENSMQTDIKISLGVLSSPMLIWIGIRTWTYNKQNCNTILNITIFLWFFIYVMGAVANVLILVSIGACLYIFIFYKGQTVPYVLLPNTTTEETIQIFTVIAFSFKIPEMIGFIYHYLNLTIFFIDWEQRKTTCTTVIKYDSPHTSFRKMYSKRFANEHEKALNAPPKVLATKRRTNSHDTDKTTVAGNRKDEHLRDNRQQDLTVQEIKNHEHSPDTIVSIWRTYFIANEWLRLQGNRRINIWLQSIATIFILKVLELHFWTLAMPELINTEEVQDVQNSFTLKYAVCTAVYVSVYLLQWLMSIGFYEQYIKNRTQEFIDLCSITNISIFILTCRYYGFYIHGRSIHGFADTDLSTLLNDLDKEENNLCAHRGLVPGTVEQAFILSVTQTFRNIYDTLITQQDAIIPGVWKDMAEIYFHWHSFFSLTTCFYFQENINFLQKDKSVPRMCKEAHKIRDELKEFLCKYIDHSFRDEDYIVKEQHFLEKLFRVIFPQNKEKSIFYIDRNHSFDQSTLYGNEWLFSTFEFTMFAFVLAICTDYVLASIIAVTVTHILTLIIKYGSKRNLSNKSLLDRRFLL